MITSAIAEINPYYNNQDLNIIKSHSHKKCCQTTNCDSDRHRLCVYNIYIVHVLTIRSTYSSWMDSSTNNLPAAMQFSPLLKNTELIP